MTTINTYERVDGQRQDRGTWDVPECFDGFRFPEALSVHQIAILEDLATSENFTSEIEDLKENWGMGRLTVNDVLRAFTFRRDDKLPASNAQKGLLRRMLLALKKAKDEDGDKLDPEFYRHLMTILLTGNEPQIREAINDARAIITQVKDVGYTVPFDTDRRDDTSAPVEHESVEELAENSF